MQNKIRGEQSPLTDATQKIKSTLGKLYDQLSQNVLNHIGNALEPNQGNY